MSDFVLQTVCFCGRRDRKRTWRPVLASVPARMATGWIFVEVTRVALGRIIVES